MKNRVIIYCDESSTKETYFSNFYGAALLEAKNREFAHDRLQIVVDKLGLKNEIKWVKTDPSVVDRYIQFIDEYFDLIEEGVIKYRVLFTHNYLKPDPSADYDFSNTYFILYYYFLRYAFGLEYNDLPYEKTAVTVLLDEVPHSEKKFNTFKDYLCRLNSWNKFLAREITFSPEEITNVDSKKHIILQGLDIILGSINFRLNDKHKIIPVGQKRRGKKTIAKEKLFKHISKRIRNIYPHFNIGISTGLQGNIENRWAHQYRHWNFKPAKAVVDSSKSKKK